MTPANMLSSILHNILAAQQTGIQSIAHTMAQAQTDALERMSRLQEQNQNQVNTIVGALTGVVSALGGADLLS